MNFLKPKHQPRKPRSPVKIFPDGREICQDTKAGREEYKSRVKQMWERQEGICSLMISSLCKLFDGIMSLESATFDHSDGRGFNGGHRDDRILKDGKPYNSAACSLCNSMKGSKRLDISDEIIP